MSQRVCPVSVCTQSEQLRVSWVLQTLCGQKGEDKHWQREESPELQKQNQNSVIVRVLAACLPSGGRDVSVATVPHCCSAFLQMLFLRINASYKLHLKRQLAHLNVVNDGGPLNGWAGALIFFPVQIIRHCLLQGSCDCRITAPRFSMSHLELSYSKGHDLGHPTVRGSAIHLVADWELDMIWLETCLEVSSAHGLLSLPLSDSSSHSLISRNCVIPEAILKCGWWLMVLAK